MTREALLTGITKIIREEFDDDSIEVNFQTQAKDVEGWDSLAHLSLIHEIEATYGVKFTMGEIQGVQNIGELLDYLIHHLENT